MDFNWIDKSDGENLYSGEVNSIAHALQLVIDQINNGGLESEFINQLKNTIDFTNATSNVIEIDSEITTRFQGPAEFNGDVYINGNVSVLTTYSTAPQQIGTWIDGMPVWRAAFKAPITDTMKIDKACSIFYDLSFVKSAERVKLVIGGFACIDNGSVIDNNTTTLDGFGRFNWDSINPIAEYISGYIDFVTEAENIKS